MRVHSDALGCAAGEKRVKERKSVKWELEPGTDTSWTQVFLLILTTLEFIQKYRNHDIISPICL